MRPLRILLAEDELDLRDMLELVLGEQGYEVTGADNGVALIREAKRAEQVGRPFDLVVTDVRMPLWSGLEAADYLRRRGLRVPVIVMTACGDDEVRAAAIDFGAAAVLEKPFELDDLLAAVRACARRPGSEPGRPR